MIEAEQLSYLKDFKRYFGEGVEPPPVVGHLSGGEPIVKPTRKVGFVLQRRMIPEKRKKILSYYALVEGK